MRTAAVATAAGPGVTVVRADGDPALRAGYAALRRRAFVEEQGLFPSHDSDDHDSGPATRVLCAVGPGGDVVGGVRLDPEGGDPALGWWRGSRLVCTSAPGPTRGLIGAALVREACIQALDAGALRFDAHVQERHAGFFARLGWQEVRTVEVAGRPHRLMRWPVDRMERLAHATKAALGPLLAEVLATPAGFLGDDASPVPGSALVASTDAILPSMVAADPEWAGWCGMLVTAHDLSAMGARPAAALDALGARDEAHAASVLAGLRDGAQALDLPLIGGHTTLGVSPALSVTGLGHAESPVPAGGAAAGDELRVTADLGGDWRPGYGQTQWDSSTRRTRDELRTMLDAVGRARPRAAKDVSMAGIAGTTGMLAEACGCGAELDVAAIPRPEGARAGDWLTCFPGFAMVTADRPDAPPLPAGAATGAACGRLTGEPGVRLRWPDGETTTAVSGPVTRLGAASQE